MIVTVSITAGFALPTSRNAVMKLTTDRPFVDPEKAARKLVEIANAVEPVQDGRIHIEKINEPFLFKEGGNPAEYRAGSMSLWPEAGCCSMKAAPM